MIAAFGFVILWCAACSQQGGENKNTTVEVTAESETAPDGPSRMQISNVKVPYEFRGKKYEASIFRCPDESLPMVKDADGINHVDNRITLRITCEGRDLLDRSFTKESFASLVDRDFLNHAILEGLVYNRSTSGEMLFAASVCYPQSDLYVPIRISVSADGRLSMTKEDVMEEDLPYDDM